MDHVGLPMDHVGLPMDHVGLPMDHVGLQIMKCVTHSHLYTVLQETALKFCVIKREIKIFALLFLI